MLTRSVSVIDLGDRKEEEMRFYFRNNTDFSKPAEFTKTELTHFLRKYHRGEAGDRYWYEILDGDGHEYRYVAGKLEHKEMCLTCHSDAYQQRYL